MSADTQSQLVALLDAAGAAHGDYERTALGGVYDEEWAAWYAAWLLDHGYNVLLDSRLEPVDLARLLSRVHEQYKASGESGSWSAFAAPALMDHLG